MSDTPSSSRPSTLEAKGAANTEGLLARLKQTEAALQQAIAERAQAEQALRKEDQRKDEFLAVLSHELRNPLAPIRNSLYILARAAPDGEQAKRALAVIDRQVGHLTRLVDDLLDVTRISQGKIKLQRERVDLASLVHRTIEDHRAVFAASGLELAVCLEEDPLWVDGDGMRLSQVVGNLLENAAKFTQRGGRVEIVLTEEGAAHAVMRIRDTGIGIAQGVLTHLFQPFTQADSSLDRQRGGLGLGLALTKGLVDLHGGSVKAHSDGPGKGAEFVVRLPLASRPGAQKEPAPAPLPERRRILVIEDNLDAAESLRMVLEMDGHVVAVAHDGPEGLKRAREFAPEVVLCDIGLPGMSGYDIARAFRADGTLRHAYLVALTGYALPDDQRRAAEAGFQRHLAKPPSLEMLEAVIAGGAAQKR